MVSILSIGPSLDCVQASFGASFVASLVGLDTVALMVVSVLSVDSELESFVEALVDLDVAVPMDEGTLRMVDPFPVKRIDDLNNFQVVHEEADLLVAGHLAVLELVLLTSLVEGCLA